MAENRKSYGEGCIAAHALDLIGDRWALLVVRELMLGPKRFGAIRSRLPGIATNMLSRRLADLETAGVLRQGALPPPASVAVYELTAQGRALGPLLGELCRWGVGVPGHDPRLPISPTALMLSMQALVRADAAGSHLAGFTLDDERFLMSVEDGRIDIRRTALPEGRIHLTAPPNAMARAVYGPQPLAALVADGVVHLDGDPSAAQSFIDLFRLERPADTTRHDRVAGGTGADSPR